MWSLLSSMPPVKTTSAGAVIRHRYAARRGRERPPLLLSPPGPGDRPLVLGMRAPHLLRVHDPGAGRPPLPRALGEAAGSAEGDARGHGRGIAPGELRDDDADRPQRLRPPRRARRRREREQRHGQPDLPAGRAPWASPPD